MNWIFLFIQLFETSFLIIVDNIYSKSSNVSSNVIHFEYILFHFLTLFDLFYNINIQLTFDFVYFWLKFSYCWNNCTFDWTWTHSLLIVFFIKRRKKKRKNKKKRINNNNSMKTIQRYNKRREKQLLLKVIRKQSFHLMKQTQTQKQSQLINQQVFILHKSTNN
jgi:hypothetical protein